MDVSGLPYWLQVVVLGAADSVNPCALAVLFMILISIMLYNPNKKKKVLMAGLAFTFSVFVMYFIYGAIIVTLLTGLMDFLEAGSIYVYKTLGMLAIVIGLLGIKDFLMYKPGTIGTEMPLMLRPKVKKIISKVTSVSGAIKTGAFVSLFLLPCTMGPLFIFASITSEELSLSLSEKLTMLLPSLPWLFIYNLIFILPMLIITLFIYYGFTTVEDAQEWKERNIRKLHLIAGIILFLIGVAMVLGWL
ncbi:MAG: hypothetical protein U9Q06_04365 [Nanoarchaeota archaeon]|nr:hypothetical protein [Nanoarchaeota archaeon]